MIHLSQTYPDDQSVTIKVEGDLDGNSLPVLEDVCRKHLESKKKITLDLAKIAGVDLSGKEFLRSIDDDIRLIGMPAYLEMQISKA